MSERKSKAPPPAKAAAASKARKASKGTPTKGATKSVPPPAATNTRAASPEIAPSAAKKEHGFRRKIVGKVTSDRMMKTVVVEVIRKAMHPMYKKYVRVRNKYKAHDELNQYRIGDRVEIMEHRPLSAEKRWLVTRLISRPVEA